MKARLFKLVCLLALVAMVVTACAPAPTATPVPPPPTAAPKAAAPTAVPPTKAPEPTKAPAPTAVPPTKAPEPTKVPTKAGEFHGAFPYQVPPTGHWNSFVTNGIPNGVSIYWDLLEMPLARYNWADGTWTNFMADKVETVPPDKVVVTIRKGANWSDGKPFTSKDVVATFDVGRLFNWSVFNYVDTVVAKDDSTIEFHMAKPSSIVKRFILTTNIRSAATYGALADKMAALLKAGKTKDADEWKALLKEATEFRPTGLIVSGPYNIDPKSITEAQLSMNWVPTAWNADKVQFGKIVLFNGETPTVTPLVLAGDVDYATHGFPPATEKAYVEQKIRIIRAPIYTGPAFYFNNDVYPLNRKEVRQAFAYVIKRDENGTASLGESGKAVKYMAGFSDNLVPLWISADDLKTFNTYAYDPAKAEALLTGIGFKKGADGVWVDDKGKPCAWELLFPAEFADWSAAAENAIQQLNKFGFKITGRGIQFQQETPQVRSGQFQIAIRSWGSANPHPYFSFVNDLYVDNYVQSTEGKGINFPMKQKLADGTEVDLQQLTNDSVLGLDEAAQKKGITTVAKVFNDMLPVVPIWERYGNNPARDTRVTGWPPDGDKRYKNAVYGDNFVVMMILDGTLKAK